MRAGFRYYFLFVVIVGLGLLSGIPWMRQDLAAAENSPNLITQPIWQRLESAPCEPELFTIPMFGSDASSR
jgi:hypothetical protein